MTEENKNVKRSVFAMLEFSIGREGMKGEAISKRGLLAAGFGARFSIHFLT